MWMIMQQEQPEDFVIATGQAYSLKQFLQFAFETVKLDWEQYVFSDPKFFRPSDPKIIVGDPSKALKKLGWKAKMTTPEIVKNLMQSKLDSIS
jgi:GDPmannose 4,6-dehydratase